MSNLESVLNQQRAPLDGPGGTITSCNQLFSQPLQPRFEEDRRFIGYQACYAAFAILNAKAPIEQTACYKNPNDCSPANVLMERLDFRTFPNSLGPRFRLLPKESPVTSDTLAKLGIKAFTSSRTSLTLDIPEWAFQIDALAAANFDDSTVSKGQEQWLLRIVDKSLKNSYLAGGYILAGGFERGKTLSAYWLNSILLNPIARYPHSNDGRDNG
jgi:hypothetical protein